MSYDPNQQPNSGYGTPPYGTPQGPYGAPQNPYGTPPGVPQQGPYGTPQGPYGQPQGQYGIPAYQQPGYGYDRPPTTPLPLGEALRQLPSQWIRVLTRPSAATFAEEQGKAAWNIVWAQLLGIAVIEAILGILIFQVALPGLMSSSNLPAGTIAAFEGVSVGYGLSLIIFVPLGFFIGTGIYYLIAKAFGGQGTFLAQSYSSLLYGVPLGIVSGVLGIIPFLGGLIALAVGIYEIVLGVYMMMAVHRLSGGKATLVVLLPLIVAVVLACVFFFIIIGIIASSQPH